jgi:VanZ family protein
MAMKNQTRFLFLWGPVAVYMAAIFFVSSLSEAPVPEEVSDKWAHALAYAGLAVVVVRAVAGGLPARIDRRAAVIAVAVATAYAATDEFHQMFVSGRSAELYDLYADFGGALAGAIACWAWSIKGAL